jgi:hypothetical protein
MLNLDPVPAWFSFDFPALPSAVLHADGPGPLAL